MSVTISVMDSQNQREVILTRVRMSVYFRERVRLMVRLHNKEGVRVMLKVRGKVRVR